MLETNATFSLLIAAQSIEDEQYDKDSAETESCDVSASLSAESVLRFDLQDSIVLVKNLALLALCGTSTICYNRKVKPCMLM